MLQNDYLVAKIGVDTAENTLFQIEHRGASEATEVSSAEALAQVALARTYLSSQTGLRMTIPGELLALGAEHRGRPLVLALRRLTHRGDSIGPVPLARRLAVRSASAVQYDAIQSIRGVQHSAPENQPYISDELTIACVMVLFLGLFTFGKK